MFKVMITGSRHWDDKDEIKRWLSHIPVKCQLDPSTEITLIHGAAKGADTLAAEVAIELGWTIERFPAQWNKYGRSAGPRRNQQMVDEKPDIVLAFPLDNSIGTKHAIRISRQANIPTFVCLKHITEGN